MPGNCAYFFTDDFAFDPKAVEKRLRPEGTRERLLKVAETFESLPAFTLESTEAALRALGESMATGIGSLVHPVRVAVSGMTEGPGLFEMLVLLGRERVCARLRQAVRMAG